MATRAPLRFKLLTLWTALLAGLSSANAHNEIVAEFIIENYNDELFVKVVLDKKHFVLALESEGDCTAAEMLSRCGNEYVQEHFKIEMNDETTALEKVSMEVGQDHVVILYRVKQPDAVLEEISAFSDYMISYNDHSVIRVVIALEGMERKSYNLSKERTEMQFKKP